MRSIIKRLEALEKQNVTKQIPTYAEFVQEWGKYDELTKALYIAEAEMPGLLGQRNRYMETVCRYLEKMGVVTEHYSLDEFVRELEREHNPN